MKIAIATCLNLPEIDPDEAITLEAFRARGHEVELVAWDDPEARFGDFSATVIRSTWNYPYTPAEFESWVHRVSTETRLLNPAEVVIGNLHKRYLLELGERGLPIVATRLFSAGEFDAAFITEKCVIKPAVGAGSWDTKSFDADSASAASTWLAGLDSSREFLIQPYFPSVHTVGEQSIMVIGGETTHCVTKRPRFAGQDESVEGPFAVEPEFTKLERLALGSLDLLYARLDLMQDPSGTWCVSELELIEPSLFFKQNPDAATKLVVALERMLA